jgi:hypothetical protein
LAANEIAFLELDEFRIARKEIERALVKPFEERDFLRMFTILSTLTEITPTT